MIYNPVLNKGKVDRYGSESRRNQLYVIKVRGLTTIMEVRVNPNMIGEVKRE